MVNMLQVKSVNILIHDASGRTLLQLRDTDTATFPLMWGFWGGAMALDDSTPSHCAAREIREELALDTEPGDYELVGVRRSSRGEAHLMRLNLRVEWGMFRVCEGAGAAFLWRQEIEALALSKPVADHLQTDPHLFAEKPPR